MRIATDSEGSDRELGKFLFERFEDLGLNVIEFASHDFVGCEDRQLSSFDLTDLGLACEVLADGIGPCVSEHVGRLDCRVAFLLDDFSQDCRDLRGAKTRSARFGDLA